MDTEKSEITNLPEGMSSEELDKLTTGEEVESPELAQEALDATEEPSPVEEPAEEKEAEKPPEKEAEEELSETEKQLRAKDAKIASLKHEQQEAAIETARLEGQLEAQKSVKTEEAPKSPLDIAEAAYIAENGNLEGFAMTGELYRQQTTFDDKQVADKSVTEKKEQANATLIGAAESLQEGDLSVDKMGQGLDLQTVAKYGDKYLTRGDRIDLQDIQARRGTATALKEAYHIMIRRVLAANNEDSQVLQSAMDTKGKKPAKAGKSQTEPKKPIDIDALTTEGEGAETGEAEAETHSKRLTDFVFSE